MIRDGDRLKGQQVPLILMPVVVIAAVLLVHKIVPTINGTTDPAASG